MRRAAFLLCLLLVAGLAPASLASGFTPPEGSQSASAGGVGLAHWVGADVTQVAQQVNESETGTLWFGMKKMPFNGTSEDVNASAPPLQRAYVNLTSADLAFATPALVLTGNPLLSTTWDYANTTFTTNLTAPATASYSFTVEVYREDANGTTLLGSTAGTGTVQVASVVVDQPPVGIPTAYLVGGGAAVVVGAGAALYAMRERRERRLMNQAPRRSQVMREMALERELQRVEEKEPERAAEIKQEIRAQEVVREKRRELQILEAKRADALKTMDLLRKRHETGGLTKLQYDNMVKKKQADLERIDAEIAQMEAEDAASGGAAA